MWSIDVDRNRCSLGGVDIPDHHDCHEQGVGKKNPTNGELSEAAKEENKSVNRIRQVVERTIAHIKSWRILHTPYRRPLETFEQTITAALALYTFKTTH